MVSSGYFLKGFSSVRSIDSPAIALACSFVAIGALLKNIGFNFQQSFFSTFFTYALPGQLVMAESLLIGTSIINIFIEIIIVVIPLFLIVAYTTYSERKIIGYMQSRLGPTRVGPSGIFQPIADVIKLATKEIIIPSNSNKGLFLTAPIIMLVPSLMVWSVIPLSEYFVIANINAGLLFVLALTSLSVYGVIIAGWASNS